VPNVLTTDSEGYHTMIAPLTELAIIDLISNSQQEKMGGTDDA
jgi:hypothetical protein